MEKTEKIRYVQKKIADDWGFAASALGDSKNIFLESDQTFFEIITFGKNAVMRGDTEMISWCKELFDTTSAQDILDGDNLYQIETKLRLYKKKLAGEHVRYLHLSPKKVIKPPAFTYKWYNENDIQELYVHPEFDSALNYQRDVLALAAYDGNRIVAMAGADDYSEPLWQIGIDTIPAYQGKGLAVYLVEQMSLEIEKRGKVPFYTTWSANMASTRVALQAGFYPVWMGYPTENV